MTATLAISVVEEKGEPEPNAKTMPEPVRKRSNVVDYIVQFYEKYFQTRCDRLKLCQIVLGLVIVVLVRHASWQYETFANYLMFLGVNIPLLTAILLWDSHNGNRLRTLLGLDRFSDNLELHFQGAAAALYYFVSFAFLIKYYFWQFNPIEKIEAGFVGMLACVVHGYNWWLLVRRKEPSGEKQMVDVTKADATGTTKTNKFAHNV